MNKEKTTFAFIGAVMSLVAIQFITTPIVDPNAVDQVFINAIKVFFIIIGAIFGSMIEK